MNRWHRALIAVATTVLVSACGENSASPLDPSGPRQSGGFSVGGNVVENPQGGTTQSVTEPTAAPTEPTDPETGGQTGGDGSSTSYGGFSVGGN